MKVAVITPTFNREKYTLNFILQLAKQEYKNFELILVDSGSTDNTLKIVNQHLHLFKINILRVPSNCYWTAATNAGVKFALASDFQAILTINDDATFDPQFLAGLVFAITQHPRYSIVSARIDFLNQTGKIWQMGSKFDWSNNAIFTGHFANWTFSELPINYREAPIVDVEANCGNGIIFKREVFEKIGFYNQKYCPHYHADTEFTLRATNAGFKIGVLPNVILKNDFPEDKTFFRRFNLFKLFFSVRSPFYVPSIIYIFLIYCPFRFWLNGIFTQLRQGIWLWLLARKNGDEVV